MMDNIAKLVTSVVDTGGGIYLENLQHRHVIEQEQIKTANSSFLEGQKFSIEARLKAIDSLWQELINCQKESSIIINYVDTQDYIEEFEGDHYDACFESVKKTCFKNLKVCYSSNFERLRLYVEEDIWCLFHSYCQILSLVSFFLYITEDRKYITLWHKKIEFQSILKQIFSDQEITDWEKQKKLSPLLDSIERKIQAKMEVFISGEKFVSDYAQVSKNIDLKKKIS